MAETQASEFDIRTTESRGVTVVLVRGQADLHAAPQLRAALTTAIDSGVNRLVVDLSEATFIDSMTLGALLGAVKRLRGQHGRLVVACSDPHIRRVFEITSLDRVFELAQTQTEALAAFARRDSGVEAGA